jgi:L-ascorbate metabolism protein UlaG (beta-lactamase superfamily)
MHQSRHGRMLIGLVVLFALFGQWSMAKADPDKPVAVRWWGHGMASIETYWNLRIIIDPYGAGIGYADPQVSGDLVLMTHEEADRQSADLVGGQPTVVRALDADGSVRLLRHVLDRLPNAPASTWKDARPQVPRSAHAVLVTSIPAWRDDAGGEQRGASAMLLVEVDGVRILHGGGLGQRTLTNDQLMKLGQVDVLLIPVGGKETVDGRAAADIVRQLKPRIVAPIRYKTPATNSELEPAEPFVDRLAPDYEIVRPVGNTLAVRQADLSREEPKIVLLGYEPWKMPEELATLFSRKEAACRASQAVFAKLSAEQMNFRPSNGTHTPRWNAEHMMGRELGFFSQIFSQLDSSVPHIDLNPKQMPPDYLAAHPDWSGAEEARQMERVTALTRRFAYLFDGLDLDEKAPGSRWTLRGLLEQMERHYQEHTENVKKKFELPDWPAR